MQEDFTTHNPFENTNPGFKFDDYNLSFHYGLELNTRGLSRTAPKVLGGKERICHFYPQQKDYHALGNYAVQRLGAINEDLDCSWDEVTEDVPDSEYNPHILDVSKFSMDWEVMQQSLHGVFHEYFMSSLFYQSTSSNKRIKAGMSKRKFKEFKALVEPLKVVRRNQ